MIQLVKETKECGFDWIDITAPSVEELKAIVSKYNLHEPSVMECLEPEHLPKYEEIDDVVFIMLRTYDYKSGDEADTIQELSRKIAVFYNRSDLITIHREEQHIIKELISLPGNFKKCTSSVNTLYNIINKAMSSYEAPAHQLLRKLDDFESDIFIRKTETDVLKSLYHLKRKAAVNNRIIHLSKDIIEHLDNHDLPETLIQDLRDLYIRLDTMYTEVQEGATNLLNIYISLSSQKTNEVVRVLTVFSVFFMPLTFIVGIYGMNFEFMPELRMKLGYPGVMVLMATITGFIYLWFKRKGWL